MEDVPSGVAESRRNATRAMMVVLGRSGLGAIVGSGSMSKRQLRAWIYSVSSSGGLASRGSAERKTGHS